MVESITYICPYCKSPLKASQDAYFCHTCNKTYYLINGIPNFMMQDEFQNTIPLIKSGTFNKIAKLYDTDFIYNLTYHTLCGIKVPSLTKLKQKIVDLCDPHGKIVLDVACGTGKFTRVIAKKAYKVYGIDISQGMLEQAQIEVEKDKLDNIILSQGNVEILPFKDQIFDTACCMGALPYFPDTVRALKEVARTLKPKSPFVIMTLIRKRIFKHKLVYEHMLKSHGAHIFQVDELLNWLDEAGFVVVMYKIHGSMILLQANKK